jgi:hypothetical protein
MVSDLLHRGEQPRADTAPPEGRADAHLAEVGLRSRVESQSREPDGLTLDDRHQGPSPPRILAVGWRAWQPFRDLLTCLKRPDLNRNPRFPRNVHNRRITGQDSRGKCSEPTRADISTISLRWFPKFCYRLFYRFVVSSAVVREQHPRFFSWPGGRAPKVDVDMQTCLMRCWLFCSDFCATANPWRVLDRQRAVAAGPAVLLWATLGSNQRPLPCQQGRPASCPRTEAQMRPLTYTGDRRFLTAV